MNFIKLSNLSLPLNLRNELAHLDRSQLISTTQGNRREFVKQLIRQKSFFDFEYFRHYGLFFQTIGNIENYRLPERLLQKIQKHYNYFFEQINEAPVVRLQMIHGGTQIPIHIDMTRSVSLIIPVANHDQASTNFYQVHKSNLKRGLINPKFCTLSQSITIDQDPVLLDIDQAHSVTYNKNLLTTHNPRISLNFKWQHIKFQEIAKLLNTI